MSTTTKRKGKPLTVPQQQWKADVEARRAIRIPDLWRGAMGWSILLAPGTGKRLQDGGLATNEEVKFLRLVDLPRGVFRIPAAEGREVVHAAWAHAHISHEAGPVIEFEGRDGVDFRFMPYSSRRENVNGRWIEVQAWGDVLNSGKYPRELAVFLRLSEQMTDFAFRAEHHGHPVRRPYAGKREKGLAPIELTRQPRPSFPRAFLAFGPEQVERLYDLSTQVTVEKKKGWRCDCRATLSMDAAFKNCKSWYSDGDFSFVCPHCNVEKMFRLENPDNLPLVVGKGTTDQYENSRGNAVVRITKELQRHKSEVEGELGELVIEDGVIQVAGYRVVVQRGKNRVSLKPGDLEDLDLQFAEERQQNVKPKGRRFTNAFRREFCAAFADGIPIRARKDCTYVGPVDREKKARDSLEAYGHDLSYRWDKRMPVRCHRFKTADKVVELYFPEGCKMPAPGASVKAGAVIAKAMSFMPRWDALGPIFGTKPLRDQWGLIVKSLGDDRKAVAMRGFLQILWFDNQGIPVGDGSTAYPVDLVGVAAGQMASTGIMWDLSPMIEHFVPEIEAFIPPVVRLRGWDKLKLTFGAVSFDGTPKDVRFVHPKVEQNENATSGEQGTTKPQATNKRRHRRRGRRQESARA